MWVRLPPPAPLIMPKGIYDKQREIARQAGIVSGMVRRERILDSYMKLVAKVGIYEALIIVRDKSWLQGYKARQKHELRHGHRKTQEHNQTG
jgi:hypothetical protein